MTQNDAKCLINKSSELYSTACALLLTLLRPTPKKF